MRLVPGSNGTSIRQPISSRALAGIAIYRSDPGGVRQSSPGDVPGRAMDFDNQSCRG